jgi:hypothetical protein
MWDYNKFIDKIIIGPMPKPSKYIASRKANLAAAQAVLEENFDKKTLEQTLSESQTELHNAQQQIASLESALSDKVAACSELSLFLQEAEMKSEEYLSQLWCSSLRHHLICAVAKLRLEIFCNLNLALGTLLALKIV